MKFFTYENLILEDIFNNFFINAQIDEKVQKMFFKNDFNKIFNFFNNDILKISNFPFEVFNASSICTCYNFYNSFIIKFGSFSVQKYLNTKKNENIFFKENNEIKPILTYNIKIPTVKRFEKNDEINKYRYENDKNDKFILQEIDCMILQPFVISIPELNDIREKINKIIDKINSLREISTEVDLNPSNIGIYNNSLYLVDW